MSTISNERLEKMAAGGGFNFNEVEAISSELLALRKERERAEPVHDQDMCDHEVFEKGASACLVDIPKEAAEIICRGISAATGYMIDWHYVGGRVHIKALRTAPPAPPVADDSLPHDPQIAEYEQMMEAEQAQADTTVQQFESLVGKSVVPAGWKLVPIELTKEMLKQIHPFAVATCLDCGRQVVADCVDNVTASWNDMLAVAPEPCK